MTNTGFLEDLLCQITLMLRLKITAPEYLVIKLIIMLFQKLYGFRIGNMAELGIKNMVQSL